MALKMEGPAVSSPLSSIPPLSIQSPSILRNLPHPCGLCLPLIHPFHFQSLTPHPHSASALGPSSTPHHSTVGPALGLPCHRPPLTMHLVPHQFSLSSSEQRGHIGDSHPPRAWLESQLRVNGMKCPISAISASLTSPHAIFHVQGEVTHRHHWWHLRRGLNGHQGQTLSSLLLG